MSKPQLPPPSEINEIMQMLYSDYFKDNPLAYVMFAFPWGKKGSPLENFKGPRTWQREELEAIAAHIKENKARIARGEDPLVYKCSVASGRGPGKSALVSWIVLWMMSCHFGATTIISANTDTQLTDKTFGEIGRWLTMAINNFFFEHTQKSIKPAPWYKKALEDEMKVGCNYYYANGVLWNEDDPESFAGAHSQIGMLLIFDESSGIPDNIWTVSKGFFTEKTIYRLWFAFSNPRSTSGAFFDVHNDPDSGWRTRRINSLDVEDLDHAELNDIIRKYGADSDEARVEVYGQFPKSGDRQFISRSVVEEAAARILEGYDNRQEALILGVDVARYGDDFSVLCFRAGRDARSIPAQIYSGLDNMQLVAKIEQAIYVHKPDYICVDQGAGTGVIDRLRELGYKVHEVKFGGAPLEAQYFDHRTELYALAREWLPGGMIPNDRDLKNGLCSPEKELIGRESKEKLESKEKMKKRGIRKSPDYADAFVMTFEVRGAKKNWPTSRKSKQKRYREARSVLD